MPNISAPKPTAKKTPSTSDAEIPVLWGNSKSYGVNYPKDYTSPEGQSMMSSRYDVEIPGFGGYTGSPEMASESLAMLSKYNEMVKPKPKEEEVAIPSREEYVKDMILPKLAEIDPEIGKKDPWTVDPYKLGLSAFNENLPRHMREMFPDVPPGGVLNPDQQKFANEQLANIRTAYINWAIKRKDLLKNLYTRMMSAYEARKKDYEQGKKMSPKQKEELEFEFKKKFEEYKKEGEPSWKQKETFRTDEAIREAKEKSKIGKKKKPSSATINRIGNEIQKLNEITRTDSREFKTQLQKIQKMLEVEGLPPLTTKEVKDKRWYLPEKWEGVKTEYETDWGKKGKKKKGKVVETRYYKGREIVKYEDGTIEYAD